VSAEVLHANGDGSQHATVASLESVAGTIELAGRTREPPDMCRRSRAREGHAAGTAAPRCRAIASRTMRGPAPLGRVPLAASPAVSQFGFRPASFRASGAPVQGLNPGSRTGAITTGGSYLGMIGAWTVQDVTMWGSPVNPADDYVLANFMAWGSSGVLAVGWGETRTNGDYRYVQAYSTTYGRLFYPQLTLTDGAAYYFMITSSATSNGRLWAGFIWYNNQWNLLTFDYLGNSAYISEEVDAKHSCVNGCNPGFPNLYFLDTSVLDAGGNHTWDTNIPTSTSLGGSYYCLTVDNAYYNGHVHWCP
jgi:hypothetical protein